MKKLYEGKLKKKLMRKKVQKKDPENKNSIPDQKLYNIFIFVIFKIFIIKCSSLAIQLILFRSIFLANSKIPMPGMNNSKQLIKCES